MPVSAMTEFASGQVGCRSSAGRPLAQQLGGVVQVSRPHQTPQPSTALVTDEARGVVDEWRHDHNDHHRRHLLPGPSRLLFY